MSEITLDEVRPLFAVLDDSSAQLRLAALRALVRLPLSRQAWQEVSQRVLLLLQGVPDAEIIEAAIFIPTKAVRDRLRELLKSESDSVRWTTAVALAQARDMAALPSLVSRLTDPDTDRRIIAAESLSLLDISAMYGTVQEVYRQKVQEVCQQSDTADVRFWLALTLARLGQTDEIEQVLTRLRQGAFDLRATWGDPSDFIAKLRHRGLFPEPARDLFRRVAQEEGTSLTGRVAEELYQAGQPEEIRASEPPPPPMPGPEVKSLAEALTKRFEESGEVDEDSAAQLLQRGGLVYLTPELVSRVVTTEFRAVLRSREPFFYLGNHIVSGIADRRGDFTPDLQGLYDCYLEAWQYGRGSPGPLAWQTAWAASRAGLDRVLSALAPHLTATDEGERLATAQLVEMAARCAPMLNPPLFGGGSTPSTISPPVGTFIDVDKAVEEPRVEAPSEPLPNLPGSGAEPPAEPPHITHAKPPAERPPGSSTEPADDTSQGPTTEKESDTSVESGAGTPVVIPLAVPPDAQSGRRSSRRVVNTGFAPQVSPDDAIDPRMPLKAAEAYFFWLDIGAPVRKSIETKPSDIPVVPAKARLTVALFGSKDGLQVTEGADTGELEVQGDGTVIVTRQPLGEAPLSSSLAKTRLFFPLQAPIKTGTYRMRCNIYWGQLLLQSRLIRARVRAHPLRIPFGRASLRSDLDYTLSHELNPAYLKQLTEHRLSLMLNKDGDGTHGFYIYGTDSQVKFKNDAVHFSEGELEGMIKQARGTLRIASWDHAEDWQEGVDTYKYKDRQRNKERLKSDLVNLASWGYEFYIAVRKKLADGAAPTTAKAAVSAFEQLMLPPGYIQIAMKESPSYVLPVALIYDYPFDVGAEGYTLCPSFENAFDHNEPLEDLECFKGNCPSRHDPRAVCPSGFWGFRHYLGMPLSIKNGPDAPVAIPFRQNLTLSVSVATDLQLLPDHLQALHQLRPAVAGMATPPTTIDWKEARTRDDVFTVLKASPHVVYFYCHGGWSRNAPFLQVGPEDQPANKIFPSNLEANDIVWEEPRPLVFINGCHTAALDPDQALQFITPLVEDSQSAGVIGTEITIFEELATTFAEECFRRFFAGQAIGEAIRGARLKLLAEGNPLGLVYIPYVMASLKLLDQTTGLESILPPAEPGDEIIETEDEVIIKGVRLRKNP